MIFDILQFVLVLVAIATLLITTFANRSNAPNDSIGKSDEHPERPTEAVPSKSPSSTTDSTTGGFSGQGPEQGPEQGPDPALRRRGASTIQQQRQQLQSALGSSDSSEDGINFDAVHNPRDPVRTDQVFPSADVVTLVGKMNVCCGIFKNPVDKKTHFYRYRYRGKSGVPGAECPVDLRNISAAMKLWNSQWDKITNIRICQSSCSALEEPSVWLTKLEALQEELGSRQGCQISFQDLNFINVVERKVFNDLSNRIMDCSVSEDDLMYFSGQDDSNLMDKTLFDL